jgi:hypothetical protein
MSARRKLLLIAAGGMVIAVVLVLRRQPAAASHNSSSAIVPVPLMLVARMPAATVKSLGRLRDEATQDEWRIALRRRIEAGASAEEILGDLQSLLDRNPTMALELALTVARTADEKYRWAATLVSQWAETDNAAAWAWALEPGHAHVGAGEPALPELVLACIAAVDPDKVVALTDSALSTIADGDVGLDAAELTHGAVRVLLGAKRDDLARESLERWATSDAGGTIGNAAFEEVALNLAQRSRAEAADWLRNLPSSEGRNLALATLAADWATTAPDEAMTWAASLDLNSGRVDAMQRVFNRWADKDIVASAQWLADHEASPQADTLIGNLVNDTSLVSVAPERALQWSALISDPTARSATVQHVIVAWATRDAAAALHYAQDTPLLSATQRQQVLEMLRPSAALPPR